MSIGISNFSVSYNRLKKKKIDFLVLKVIADVDGNLHTNEYT